MALLTPPPTLRKTSGFFKPYTRQTYYEDVYGTRDPDEELDVPDLCESDSDDEDEEAIEEPPRGLFSFPSTYGNIQSQQHAPTGQGPTIPDGTETQYKIAPYVNTKSSIPVTSSKKLAPKKFGMFATSDPRDATVVSDIESGDEEEDVPEVGGVESLVTGSHGKKSGRRLGKTSCHKKRNFKGPTIERPKSRRLISQEIAEHAQQRKAALRAGRTAAGQTKASARAVSKSKGSVRHPIVTEDYHEDGISAKSQRDMLQEARDARASRRGGNGSKAANTPSDKSSREIGNQEFGELVKRKLFVAFDNNKVNVDEYVRYD